MSTIITVLVVLVIVGLVLWLVTESGYVPIAAPIKVVIRVVVLLLVVVWLLQVFGVWNGRLIR